MGRKIVASITSVCKEERGRKGRRGGERGEGGKWTRPPRPVVWQSLHGDKIDISSVDADSGRSALHKAAFWGHDHVVKFLLANGCPVHGPCGSSSEDFRSTTSSYPASPLTRSTRPTTLVTLLCTMPLASATPKWSSRSLRRVPPLAPHTPSAALASLQAALGTGGGRSDAQEQRELDGESSRPGEQQEGSGRGP